MQTLRASKCGLSTSKLSPAILEIIDSLSKAGYDAYIVGGGVRDLMLGENPKDFDAVTNATPAQIKQVFGRRCRIIGRRFELAHVHSGRELIEVATFRAPPKKAVTSASGMILRDNNWGSIEQDFSRRDFSINAMYYQPRQGIVLDFCEAFQDIQQKKLRLLGDPKQRFEEDPVRMLRTLRFAAKLGFQIDQGILDIFTPECTQLLREVSPHRLYDESQKMFSMGKLTQLLPLLIQFHIWQQLLADLKPKITPLMQRAAENTDKRIAQGKSINSAFFYAVLLWQPYLERMEFYRSKGVIDAEARAQASIDVLKRQATRTIIPRFAETFIREVWEMQTRLIAPKAQHIMQLVNHARFRAGFDFLLLREQSGDAATQNMGAWWEQFQELNNDQKEKAIADYRRQQQRSRKKTTEQSAEPFVPLVLETEVNSRAARRAKQKALVKQQRAEIIDKVPVSMQQGQGISPDHPILKRRRVQRDLSHVVFGPTQ
ncbi:polynucleotide adenylyltransferase PcnB [Acinetobacter qingfengensis]|uniref:Poly(A) polymerase I n=1 Tax=Acinetobacter qingfengensis TaxID=1262585 RepID=A0A1E7QXD3_9GAMM|nr:polynucleotide adenylyltransferase PcnB [Acinetobacter qingfengensis]KAA8731624.1 polynucleotide adenylyltransferase PcnB [Acinetobacter qingfengensis]OEY91727.1 poly(A) polymerase [Acinetobacter qingfengensis]